MRVERGQRRCFVCVKDSHLAKESWARLSDIDNKKTGDNPGGFTELQPKDSPTSQVRFSSYAQKPKHHEARKTR